MPCGKEFGGGVTDGVAFKVVCGEDEQLCNDCRKEEAISESRLNLADENLESTDSVK